MWSLLANLASPKHFFYLSDKAMPWLTGLFILSFSYGLIGGLVLVPADYIQGDGFRIIYVHAPCAFLSLFVYAVMAAAAAGSRCPPAARTTRRARRPCATWPGTDSSSVP